VLAVVTVSVEVPKPPLTVLGLKLADKPVTNPVTLIETLALNPFRGDRFAV
jgi:hypothetical protein